MKRKIFEFFFGYDDPVNFYEQSPFLSIVIMLMILTYAVIGIITLLK